MTPGRNATPRAKHRNCLAINVTSHYNTPEQPTEGATRSTAFFIMTQSNLVLHCGAAKVERSQLTDIVTPQGGQTWCPIPHATLVAEVEGALVRANMRIVSEAHGLSADGARYFGL